MFIPDVNNKLKVTAGEKPLIILSKTLDIQLLNVPCVALDPVDTSLRTKDDCHEGIKTTAVI